MLTIIIIAASVIALAAISSADEPTVPSQPPNNRSNPLVAPWIGPYGGVPPWDQAKPELFPAAFDAALAEQRAEIDAIASDPAAPAFDNTIAA
jgi:peptidyl-dipeptidase Dcp